MNHHIDGILVNSILIPSMKDKYVTEFVILKQIEIKKILKLKLCTLQDRYYFLFI